MDKDRVQDRMKYLEEREKRLEKESHELREQNELLEFRILELEENQDKVRRNWNNKTKYGKKRKGNEEKKYVEIMLSIQHVFLITISFILSLCCWLSWVDDSHVYNINEWK